MNTTLYHHGILGQKWGKRNGPPYPLDSNDHSSSEEKAGWKKSLDSSSKSNYNVNIEGAQKKVEAAKAAAKKANAEYNSDAYNTEKYKKAVKAENLVSVEKRNLKDEKIKSKLNEETSKSNRRLKLEQYYKEKGLSDEEAAVAAYKREKTEKIIAATAVLTVAAVTAYVAYNHYDTSVDKFIKSGDILSRISMNGDFSVKDAFYVSMSKSDRTTYEGLYGKSLSSKGDVFQKSISALSDIKVASEKSATQTLANLVNDSSSTFKDELKTQLSSPLKWGNEKQQKVVTKALESLSKGKVDSNVYSAFNMNLVGNNSSVATTFYDAMKKAGYGAIADVNDRKFSGYGTKTATIVFDKAKTSVTDVKKMSESEISSSYAKTAVKAAAKSTVSSIATVAALVSGTKAVNNTVRNKTYSQIVTEYRKEHPNTQLSEVEILRNYYGD